MMMGVENSTQEGSMGGRYRGEKPLTCGRGKVLGTAPMVKRGKKGMISKETIL